jgi:N-acetyl-S-(2-succino)cysteine monooxygenase
MSERMLHLNAFLLTTGHYEAAWRMPETAPEETLNPRHYARFAQIAERGKLDSVFLADGLAVGKDIDFYSRDALEPFTLLSAMAMLTEHIGLIGTGSTSYLPPFDVARKLASLDHISSGRAGWNIVTSALEDEAFNFGNHREDHGDRYARATEFLEVTCKLWDSWEDDARVIDKQRGLFIDPAKVHRIDHHGKYYTVRGPLNMPRPVQGRPLLVQAGASEAGQQYAARFADAVFSPQRSCEGSLAAYSALKARMPAFGRDPDSLCFMPGLVFILGGTEAEAEQRKVQLDELVHASYGIQHLSRLLEYDLTGYPLDGPLPELPGGDNIQGGKTRHAFITRMAREESMTIRQIILRISGGHGHFSVVGTPEQLADEIERWWRSRAADGFNLMPAALPSGLEHFVDEVVPLLQRRGIFRTEYEGRTLRDRYGLPRPAGRINAKVA